METVQTLSQPEEYKKDIKSIETFAQFLDEFYDTEELLFFLNARFVVFNELERLPTPTSKSAQVHSIFVDFCLTWQKSVLLTTKMCTYLSQMILYTTPPPVIQALLPTISRKIAEL